jgi:hypothetical protein
LTGSRVIRSTGESSFNETCIVALLRCGSNQIPCQQMRGEKGTMDGGIATFFLLEN